MIEDLANLAIHVQPQQISSFWCEYGIAAVHISRFGILAHSSFFKGGWARGRGHWLKNRVAFEGGEQLEATDRCIPACIEPSVTHLVVPLLTQSQQIKPSRPRNMDLYKTALCDYWAAGMPCRFGDRCW
uniref:C3H1-type domain-containing protein n=1 Tax=Ascaris lumbricoides TaxID=6252 RepID=A0A0M3IV59_ASCLU